MIGTTTRQIMEAAQSASTGMTVFYVAASARHADYCAALAREVVGCTMTEYRRTVVCGAGQIRFVSCHSPAHAISGTSAFDVVLDHSVEMDFGPIHSGWKNALQRAEYLKEIGTYR